MSTASRIDLNSPFSKWELSFSGEIQFQYSSSCEANIPGDVITDLMTCSILPGEPYFDNNFFQAAQFVSKGKFTYLTKFQTPSRSISTSLFFDSIKMGASIRLNGQELGEVTDQFLRHNFTLPPTLMKLSGEHNVLEVLFDNDNELTTDGRFMACTGGWDWAPYTYTLDLDGHNKFSFGIIDDVYLMTIDEGDSSSNYIVSSVIPSITYLGAYPTEPLLDGAEGDFLIVVRTFVTNLSPSEITGKNVDFKMTAFVSGIMDEPVETTVSIDPSSAESEVTLSFTVDGSSVDLWWPNNLGAQTLYDLKITLDNIYDETIRIGFKHLALVTFDDTNPNILSNATVSEGSLNFGYFFRINGAILLASGANMVPLSQREATVTPKAEVAHIANAAAANMNMLRIWGGGTMMSREFYDAADEHGILIFHDILYAQGGHDPRDNAIQRDEIIQLVRTIAPHVSICAIDGCNECAVQTGSDTDIYATFVMRVVGEALGESSAIPIMPSCPSKGWDTGVHTLNGTFNGNDLTAGLLERPNSIEVHGPYTHGSSRTNPATNGQIYENDEAHNKTHFYDPQVPVIFDEYGSDAYGPSSFNYFASEFGASVFSSFESLSVTLSEEHWSVHGGSSPGTCTTEDGFQNNCTGGNVMSQRNYPCDNNMEIFFGSTTASQEEVGEAAFKKQLYQCMTGVALHLKSVIEYQRSKNIFGNLLWQFNENWPTGGWGVVEYGLDNLPGQVLGGRWKILAHMLHTSLFQTTMASCGAEGKCFVKHNGMRDIDEVKVEVVKYNVVSGESENLTSHVFSLKGNVGDIKWFKIDDDKWNAVVPTEEILRVSIEGGNYMPDRTDKFENVILLTTPVEMNLPEVKLSTSFVDDKTVLVKNQGGGGAVYVMLTTLAQGRFVKNGFLLEEGAEIEIEFVPIVDDVQIDVELLQQSTRVECANDHIEK